MAGRKRNPQNQQALKRSLMSLTSVMQRRTLMSATLATAAVLASLGTHSAWAQNAPKIVVTDLAMPSRCPNILKPAPSSAAHK